MGLKRARRACWEEAKTYLDQYDHPLWSDLTKRAEGAGHGGMDYIEDYRLIKCLREGLPTDMNVYDAAALSAVIQLSERSMRAAAALSTFLTSHAAAGARLNRWVSFARKQFRLQTGLTSLALSLGARKTYIHYGALEERTESSLRDFSERSRCRHITCTPAR